MAEPEKRKERRDKGQPRWTKRDQHLLTWVGEQYAVRLDQLQVLLSREPLGETKEEDWVTESTVRHCLERWRRGGVAKYASLVVGEPAWVWLTPKGLRLMGLEYRPWEPGLPRLRHLYYVNEARLWVEDHHEGVWYSERSLWASQEQPKGRQERNHLVDGEWVEKGAVIAIEVELSRKEEKRLREILYGLHYGYVGGIWYFTLPLIFVRLKRVLKGMSGEDRLKGKLHVLEWDQDEQDWVYRGNGMQIAEEMGTAQG